MPDSSILESNVPGIFTIFGVTGDLAAKKIIPSLWHLQKEGRLPKRFFVVGFARRDLSRDDFEKIVRSSVEKIGGAVPDDTFADFFSLFTYYSGTFEDPAAYSGLAEVIAKKETEWEICASKLYYLAVPPSAYESIFDGLAGAKLNLPCGEGGLGWSRLLIEKPFGHDLQSARELNQLLQKYFKPEQVYQIDHYLFKEIVQGIENFRFSNNLFESSWDRTTIERIDIRLLESIGVEGRGSFYDDVGTLRDVGQNHMLTMLAAITMEYPLNGQTAAKNSLEYSDAIRKNRAAILETLLPWTDELVKEKTYRSQYEGYQEIQGVRAGSSTETYFALETELKNSPRWAGVPIYFEAGKRMGEARKEIVLTLRHPGVCLLCETGHHGPNLIVFRLEPNDEIVIHFWTKKPGFEQVLEERTMSFFLYEKTTHIPYVEEYAKVIHGAMVGEQSLFVSPQEVEALWKFTDPVVKGWERNLVPLESYTPDTTPQPKLLTESSSADTTDTMEQNWSQEVGFIGLGKMGANLMRQVHSKGWKVTGFNPSPEARIQLASEGMRVAASLSELVQVLPRPSASSGIATNSSESAASSYGPGRLLWLMVPYTAVDDVLKELVPLLEKGDTIIDGGNSPYKESIRRHKELAAMGINFLDAGVSGGPYGALHGACIMVGGKRELYEKFEALFKDMSVPAGYAYLGEGGAGHFVKMVHNGIEYGMMQAIGEGFEILKTSSLSINVEVAAELYQHGSVIESRLVGWLADAYKKYGRDLADISPTVAASGEGQWTVDEAKELGVPAAIIEGALEFRKHSAEHPSYNGRVVSVLRNEFGGHDASINK